MSVITILLRIPWTPIVLQSCFPRARHDRNLVTGLVCEFKPQFFFVFAWYSLFTWYKYGTNNCYQNLIDKSNLLSLADLQGQWRTIKFFPEKWNFEVSCRHWKSLQSLHVECIYTGGHHCEKIMEICFSKFSRSLDMGYFVWVWSETYIPWLTHWGRVTHICVSEPTSICSDNGLSPGRRQAIIWTNAWIFLIGPLGTNFSEIVIEIQTFSLRKMRFKISSAKRQPFCLGLNVLRWILFWVKQDSVV